MAEDQKPLQATFLLHRSEGQQSSQGLAGSRTCKHQQIAFMLELPLQSAAQQLNQLLLPLPWTDRRDGGHPGQVIGERCDGACCSERAVLAPLTVTASRGVL